MICNRCSVKKPKEEFKLKKNGKLSKLCLECNKKALEWRINSQCNGNSKRLCKDLGCDICFNKSFASFDQEKVNSWSLKNIEIPRQIFQNSHKKFLFDCKKCNHKFLVSLHDIVQKDSWCPYCNSKNLCDDQNCQFCFEMSFASFEDQEKIECWSDKNILQPRHIFKNSSKKCIFDCKICKHEFSSVLSNIIRGDWCPYCSIPSKCICFENECVSCFNKSFANFENKEKLSCWSDKNDIEPRQVLKGSNKKYLFNCKNCKHEFLGSINSIVTNNQWCPYCGHIKMCFEENCQFCFNMSFASFENQEKLNSWSNKNCKNARQVFKSSGSKYLFDCQQCGNEFLIALNSIVKGQWCSKCKNKTELKVYNILTNIFGKDDIIKDKTFKWCKNKKCLPFDFLIISENKLVELDGDHHFRQVSNWSSPEDQQLTDTYKAILARQHGYDLVRMYQPDILKDKIEWEDLNKEYYSVDKTKYKTHKKLLRLNKDIEYKNYDDFVDNSLY